MATAFTALDNDEMTINERMIDGDWSLWDVSPLGMLLLTQDGEHVLIQTVDQELGGPDPIMVSRSPSGRRTVLVGEGGHPEIFETSLGSYLEILGIDRTAATQITRDDIIPAIASAMSM